MDRNADYFRELGAQTRALLPECIELRRSLHMNPELSLSEEKTAAALSSFLKKYGLSPVSYDFPSVVCDTGPEPAIALRADMDALPVREDSEETFSSVNEEVMHACGHDAHSAILAGAGALIGTRGEAKVRLIFQPAEEVGKGARMMIEAGALNGISRIFGLHVWPSLDTGSVAILDGPAMAALDAFSIEISGGGGHGAYPHLAKDTILASSSIVTEANWLVSRIIDPVQSAVLSFGSIHGGSAANVIPSDVKMQGTIRTFSGDVRDRLMDGLQRVCDRAAGLFGVGVAIKWRHGSPPVVNDSSFAGNCRTVASAFMKSVDCNRTMGSEDFSFYLEKVKGSFAFLGTGSDERTRASKHSNKFRLDEEAIYYGIMLEVAIAESASKWY